MWDIEFIKKKLKKNLTGERFAHSMNVMATAEELARHYGENPDKARVAGLLHDCGKVAKGEDILRLCISSTVPVDEIARIETGLLHAPLGVFLARELYGVDDEEIFAAIAAHSTGCRNMSMLQKIIFIADYVEPGRKYEGLNEVRKEICINLDKSLLIAFNQTIKRVIDRGKLLHPDTVDARNYLLKTKL